MNFQTIETYSELQQCCQSLVQSEFIAVDTEFHRETTYFPKLALIQIADANNAFIIDPLHIDNLTPFFELMNNPDITKVLHAARQDFEIFFHLQHKLPKPIFDTQIAASLLGYGEQMGYAALVKQLLSIELDKTQTRTDWMKRPLAKDQLDYAAGDVIYLAKIYPLMKQSLQKLGRLEWLKDDFDMLSHVNTYRIDGRKMWHKIKTANRLSGLKLAMVQELADWREQKAISNDQPRRRILSDDAIADISIQQPDSIQSLRSMRSINSRMADIDLSSILDCLQKARDRSESDWPRHTRAPKPTSEQSAIADALSAILQHVSTQNNISPSFICARKELVKLAQNNLEVPSMQGWRQKLIGRHFLQFLNGESKLYIKNNEIQIEV